MRLLGVDFGDSRTGVAVSDELLLLAQPVGTIFQKNSVKVAEQVARLAEEYHATRIVVGFPKNMNNTVGPRGEYTMQFVDILKTYTASEIILWDERLTTVSAIRTFNEANVRGKKRKEAIDTMAAVLILQNYLDYLKTGRK